LKGAEHKYFLEPIFSSRRKQTNVAIKPSAIRKNLPKLRSFSHIFKCWPIKPTFRCWLHSFIWRNSKLVFASNSWQWDL